MKEVFSLDTRLYGFLYCTEPGTEILTTVVFQLAREYGAGELINLSPLGTGTENCLSHQFSDMQNSKVERLEFFTFGRAVTGFKVETATSAQLFGLTRGSDVIIFEFEKTKPLVGLFGFVGDPYINGVGVILFDIACQDKKELEK